MTRCKFPVLFTMCCGTAYAAFITSVSNTSPACSQTGTSFAICSASLPPLGGEINTFTGTASASYLSFAVSYGYTFVATQVGGNEIARAIDTLTISGISGIGYLVYTFNVTANFNNDIGLTSVSLDNGTQFGGALLASSGPVGLALPFTYGAPFPVTTALNTISGHSALGVNITASLTRIDISSTAPGCKEIFPGPCSSITPVTGYTFSSDSGTAYPFVGSTAAPEPSSWILFGSGTLLCCVMRRVRRQGAHR